MEQEVGSEQAEAPSAAAQAYEPGAAAELRVSGLALGPARAIKLGEHRGACMEPLAAMEATA